MVGEVQGEGEKAEVGTGGVDATFLGITVCERCVALEASLLLPGQTPPQGFPGVGV